MSAPAVEVPETRAHSWNNVVNGFDWARLGSALNECGFATTGPLLDPAACRSIADLYDDERLFRSHVRMARYGFGQGEHKYFARPLPDIVGGLRETLYPHLIPVANRWLEKTGRDDRFPDSHAQFLERCHGVGQQLPTPLLLRYREGDYNYLHQDLYRRARVSACR